MNTRRCVALLFALVTGMVAGCDNLVAYCNAGGYGTPAECEARWNPCAALEQSCAAGDADACADFQQCG